MTEAVTAVNDFAFRVLGVDVLYVCNAITNEASRRVKQKTGAEFVGFIELPHHNGQSRAEKWRVTRRAGCGVIFSVDQTRAGVRRNRALSLSNDGRAAHFGMIAGISTKSSTMGSSAAVTALPSRFSTHCQSARISSADLPSGACSQTARPASARPDSRCASR